MEALQIKKPALSAVWHDKHAVKAPSAHTVGNYIISPQLSNGDGVSERARYTERDRWTSHVATESLQPHWSNAGRVPLFTGVVVISPHLKYFSLASFLECTGFWQTWECCCADKLKGMFCVHVPRTQGNLRVGLVSRGIIVKIAMSIADGNPDNGLGSWAGRDSH